MGIPHYFALTIIDALKDKYSLPVLMGQLGFSKSSYYYQEAALKRPDKYTDIRSMIQSLFHENSQRYGYRRIYGFLRRGDVTVSEKVIRRIMREENLIVSCKRRRLRTRPSALHRIPHL